MADLYFWRQAFILVTNMFCSISIGSMLSFTSVMNPALLVNNTTDIRATTFQTSWLVTSNGVASIFGFFVMSPVMQICGRKIVHMMNNLLLLIGWIIFTQATNVTALFAARIIHGLVIGGIYVQIMIISEYTNPKRRGYFMTIKKSSVASGILLCHAFSLIWNWRQIAAFVSVLTIISMVLTLFWPESPSYLAMRGRYKECEKSFIWLHGSSNMQELQMLLSCQTQNLNKKTKEKWFTFLCKRDFIKPFAIVCCLTMLLELCGKYYYIVFVTQIMIELVGDNSIAIYCSIAVDLLTVAAFLSSCFVFHWFKRRTMLFLFGAVAVSLMLIICLIIFFNVPARLWLTPTLILVHSFIVNIGISPVSFTVIGEVIPLEYKGRGSCLAGIVFTSLYTVVLKLTPFLMEKTGIEGVYGIYGATTLVCLFMLYFMVPETKDKTLQEIENNFKAGPGED